MINLSKEEFLKFIPSYVIKIGEELQKENYKAYLVGGCIRDILLGKNPDDFDIATDAEPEEIERIFPKSIPTGKKFGTITVITEDEKGEKFDVEVTTFRSEADYFGGRWPVKVEFTKTIEEDLKRRDFTINAIALDIQRFDDGDVPVHEILIDPFGGLLDLQNKIIKAVCDPIERFSEDGLRPVRACRFASQLEFSIETKTFAAIKETLHITKRISVERFRDEFLKLLLKSSKPSKGLILLKDSGILEIFIPELLEGIDVVQPEFHADDVFTHSLKACDAAEDSIKIAALLHDVGKPRTKTEDEKGIHFYGHDILGADMAEDILRRLKFPNSEVARVKSLIRWHMFYYPSSEWRNENDVSQVSYDRNESVQHGWTDGAIRRLIKNVGGLDAIDDLLKLRIADQTANPKYKFNSKELEVLSERIAKVKEEEMAIKISDLDITGEDLMKNFNLSPGRIIGNTLNYLLEKVIDDPILNKREKLLELSESYIKQHI